VSFTVKTREAQVGVFTVYPCGVLDAGTSPLLEKRVSELLESAAKVIVFDLRDLTYISSAGVRIIIKTRRIMSSRSGEFALLNPQPPVKKVLDIIGLLPTLKIFKDEQDLDQYLDAMQRSVGHDDAPV
jgi:anti-sigma B factor antagonist